MAGEHESAPDGFDHRALAARIRALAPEFDTIDAVALAVSGGGDSMALLLLAADLMAAAVEQRSAPLRIVALTVDHALRPESAAEARRVGDLCADLGVEHHILRWDREADEIAGNLQSAARAARYRLMAERRRALGVGPLITAHTADDVAETFLMRLARGSGVDGLARMAARRVEDAAVEPPLEIWRPLLDVDRATLRKICAARGVAWIEDPSNADARFARVRARKMSDALASLGLDKRRILRTAVSMARARAALDAATASFLETASEWSETYGALRLDRAALATTPREIGLRATAQALRSVGGRAEYPPRLDAVEAAFDAWISERCAAADASRTLHGCVAALGADGALWIGREARAAAALELTASEPGARRVWDGRFVIERVCSSDAAPLRVAALGARAPKRRSADEPPRLIRSGGPGLWRDGALLGALSRENAVEGVVAQGIPPRFG